jgi:cellulose synthase/poly-beta-1,6-N-acetylglucosamine synthase-like glycosyltransferase
MFHKYCSGNVNTYTYIHIFINIIHLYPSTICFFQFIIYLGNLPYCHINFFFLVGLGLGTQVRNSKAGALQLEPHLQSILLWLFWRWGSHELSAQAGLEPWISASQAARITGVNNKSPSILFFKAT